VHQRFLLLRKVKVTTGYLKRDWCRIDRNFSYSLAMLKGGCPLLRYPLKNWGNGIDEVGLGKTVGFWRP
jgi:hypothetical protein